MLNHNCLLSCQPYYSVSNRRAGDWVCLVQSCVNYGSSTLLSTLSGRQKERERVDNSCSSHLGNICPLGLYFTERKTPLGIQHGLHNALLPTLAIGPCWLLCRLKVHWDSFTTTGSTPNSRNGQGSTPTPQKLRTQRRHFFSRSLIQQILLFLGFVPDVWSTVVNKQFLFSRNLHSSQMTNKHTKWPQ